MKMYRNFDTGVIFTEDEVRETFEQFKDEIGTDDFEEYLDNLLALGKRKEGGLVEFEVNTGRSFNFEYDGMEFMFTVIGTICECYAHSQFQFAFELETDEIEADEEIIELLINNYENGNIDIDD